MELANSTVLTKLFEDNSRLFEDLSRSSDTSQSEIAGYLEIPFNTDREGVFTVCINDEFYLTNLFTVENSILELIRAEYFRYKWKYNGDIKYYHIHFKNFNTWVYNEDKSEHRITITYNINEKRS